MFHVDSLFLVGSASLTLLAVSGCVDSPAAIRDCIVDVWLQPERIALACPEIDCPECTAADCKMRPFSWFLDADTLVEGFALTAASLDSFSSAGAPIESAWRLDGDNVLVGDRGGTVSCESATMIWDGRNFERAPATAATQFEDAYAARNDEGSWRGQILTLE